jgi:hypothetical protein
MDSERKHQRLIARAFERFLNQPVPLVLVAMGLTGVAIISVCVLALYLFSLALEVIVRS